MSATKEQLDSVKERISEIRIQIAVTSAGTHAKTAVNVRNV